MKAVSSSSEFIIIKPAVWQLAATSSQTLPSTQSDSRHVWRESEGHTALLFLHNLLHAFSLTSILSFSHNVLFRCPFHFLVSFPPCLFLPFVLSVLFHFSTRTPSTSSLYLTLQPAPKKKKKMGKSKSCSLLWHLCLPTHNAVPRFVQLPGLLLVYMYLPTSPTPHLFLISQQRQGMLYFQLQHPPPTLHPCDCYSGKYTEAFPHFLLLNLETKRGE